MTVRVGSKPLIPRGFRFNAVTAGIKQSGAPDLALVEAASGTQAAALFTRNRVVAAPVTIGRRSLAQTNGRIRAVLVNSGNANCATGPRGLRDCERTCAAISRELHLGAYEIFPSSTGVIGVPLPADKLLHATPKLAAAVSDSSAAFLSFARAIMTTDTRMKVA